jgi:hypothetical protein
LTGKAPYRFESGFLQQRVCEPALAALISAQRKRDQCVRLSLALGFAMRTGRCSPAWTAAISTVSALDRGNCRFSVSDVFRGSPTHSGNRGGRRNRRSIIVARRVD